VVEGIVLVGVERRNRGPVDRALLAVVVAALVADRLQHVCVEACTRDVADVDSGAANPHLYQCLGMVPVDVVVVRTYELLAVSMDVFRSVHSPLTKATRPNARQRRILKMARIVDGCCCRR
jgi:hypothetical protein